MTSTVMSGGPLNALSRHTSAVVQSFFCIISLWVPVCMCVCYCDEDHTPASMLAVELLAGGASSVSPGIAFWTLCQHPWLLFVEASAAQLKQ